MTTFKGEAEEHILAVSRMLTSMGKSADPDVRDRTLESAYREVHSLKGAARSVNIDPLVSICRSMEDIFNYSRDNKVYPDNRKIKDLLLALDWMSDFVKAINPEDTEADYDVASLLQLTRQLEQTTAAPPVDSYTDPPVDSEPDPVIEQGDIPDKSPGQIPSVEIGNSFRVNLKSVYEIKSLYDEVYVSSQKSDRQLAEIRKERKSLQEMKKLIDLQCKPLNLNGNTVIQQQEGNALVYLDKLKKTIEQSERDFTNRFRIINLEQEQRYRMFRELGNHIDELLKQPVISMLEIFPPMVRKLSGELGKKVEIDMHGTDQRIDRRIIENIKDPLVHIVRNAIDHGIETPSDRRKLGKTETGQIQISVNPVSGKLVEIEVQDDGAGIDREVVKKHALNKGVIKEAELKELSPSEIDALVFRSGFTTTRMITELSGRGLGMAIVKENVERIGGEVQIDSIPGKGTRFRMIIPHSFGSVKGIRIKAGGQLFIIPERYIEAVVSLDRVAVRSVEGSRTVIYRTMDMNVYSLKDLLGVKDAGTAKKQSLSVRYDQQLVKSKKLLIVHRAKQWIALEVDEVIRDHEFILKPLPFPLEQINTYEGLAVLSTGKPVLVVNMPYLLDSIAHGPHQPVSSQVKGSQIEKKHRILVVEDSMTARMLIRDILESASLEVTTANDGQAGWEFLTQESFDLVVSDIEMPNMDGITLTEKIKADKNLGDLPVILVTSLKSKEDRLRGLEAGADAYIEKGGFEPEYLISVVEKLISE